MTQERRFLFRLALASGFWIFNPDALAAAMPYRILQDWAEFYRLEPFGEWRADVRSAIVAATFANVMKSKKSPAAKIDQFIAANLINTSQRRLTDKERVQKAILTAKLMGWKVNIGG